MAENFSRIIAKSEVKNARENYLIKKTNLDDKTKEVIVENLLNRNRELYIEVRDRHSQVCKTLYLKDLKESNSRSGDVFNEGNYIKEDLYYRDGFLHKSTTICPIVVPISYSHAKVIGSYQIIEEKNEDFDKNFQIVNFNWENNNQKIVCSTRTQQYWENGLGHTKKDFNAKITINEKTTQYIFKEDRCFNSDYFGMENKIIRPDKTSIVFSGSEKFMPSSVGTLLRIAQELNIKELDEKGSPIKVEEKKQEENEKNLKEEIADQKTTLDLMANNKLFPEEYSILITKKNNYMCNLADEEFIQKSGSLSYIEEFYEKR